MTIAGRLSPFQNIHFHFVPTQMAHHIERRRVHRPARVALTAGRSPCARSRPSNRTKFQTTASTIQFHMDPQLCEWEEGDDIRVDYITMILIMITRRTNRLCIPAVFASHCANRRRRLCPEGSTHSEFGLAIKTSQLPLIAARGLQFQVTTQSKSPEGRPISSYMTR